MSISTLVFIGMIAIPITDWINIWNRGERYRQIKRERGTEPIVAAILSDVERFYTPKWYHFVFPMIGALMLIFQLAEMVTQR